jgi:DNA-binding NarL/FixJ family response regulator
VVRIIIVDDNIHFLESACAFLERQGVVVVGVASTLVEAIQLASDVKPDVALVDIALGAESGFDVAESLGQLPDDVRPKIVLISTYDEADFADMIASCCVVGFVTKSNLSAAAIYALVGKAPDPEQGAW